MKGIRNAEDLYGAARMVYADGRYQSQHYADVYMAIGNQRQRLWFIGDRILDILEQRMLRDQEQVPPGLMVHVVEYQMLLAVKKPKVPYNTTQAHDLILDTQERLVRHLHVKGEEW